MIYLPNPVAAKIIKKVNRFLALVELNGEVVKAHIPNSGRLNELMTPGRAALLQEAGNRERKTAYTLKSVYYNKRWVCIDSNSPNKFVKEMFKKEGGFGPFKGYSQVRPEHSLGKHRFDFLLTAEQKKPLLVEVKSVTLVEDGIAKFPDAPTVRGRSHVETLTTLVGNGYDCLVLFVIQRSDAKLFQPNIETDPEFTNALILAEKAGVDIRAIALSVGKRDARLIGEVNIRLGR